MRGNGKWEEIPLLKTEVTRDDLVEINSGFERLVEEVYNKLPREGKKVFHLFLYVTETYKIFFAIVYLIRMILLSLNKGDETIPLVIPDWLQTLYADTEITYFFRIEDFIREEYVDGKRYIIWRNIYGKEDRFEIEALYRLFAEYNFDVSLFYKYIPPDLYAFFYAYSEFLEKELS